MYGPDLAYIHHAGFSEFAESAAAGIAAILQAGGILDGVVVDAGCGSGVLARELAARGYTVAGFDPSPAMVAIARDTAPAATFDVASLDTATLPRCRAVVAVGEVLNYAGMTSATAFFRAASSALEPRGLLLFDAAETGDPPHGEFRTGGDDWSVIAIGNASGRRMTRRVLTFRRTGSEVCRTEEIHDLELFDRRELARLVREAGFSLRVRRSYGTRRLPPGHSVYIAQRREV